MSVPTRTRRYIADGGRQKSNRSTPIGTDITQPFPLAAHLELRQGYAAAVSFVDAQVGRLLDAVDELELWDELTVVLTSDHGMHNGMVWYIWYDLICLISIVRRDVVVLVIVAIIWCGVILKYAF